jgi:hypothetical protein
MNPDIVKEFAQIVESYCALVDGHVKSNQDEFLRAVHWSLSKLYVGALALPTLEPADAEEARQPVTELETKETPALTVTHDEWAALFASLTTFIGERGWYAEVYEPYASPAKEDLVTTHLADDLTDIYRDLRDGLTEWRRGQLDAAIWNWRLSFTAHWGSHAIDALRALHTLASLYDLGFSQPDRNTQ